VYVWGRGGKGCVSVCEMKSPTSILISTVSLKACFVEMF
jgi:hypothetical protein